MKTIEQFTTFIMGNEIMIRHNQYPKFSIFVNWMNDQNNLQNEKEIFQKKNLVRRETIYYELVIFFPAISEIKETEDQILKIVREAGDWYLK